MTAATPLSRRDCLPRLGAVPWLAGLGTGLAGCEKSGIGDMPENLGAAGLGRGMTRRMRGATASFRARYRGSAINSYLGDWGWSGRLVGRSAFD